MARFEIQDHEVRPTSAVSDGQAPWIRLEGTDPTTSTPMRTWLHFEPVPRLYAARGGIGFGKVEPRDGFAAEYWVYLDRSTFDEVGRTLSVNGSIGVRLVERTHPGAAEANRLVTAVELVIRNVAQADDEKTLLSSSA